MQELTWWQHAVIYEIYPRSFQDSNGDGIGDLNGILKRIDYLVVLGVDAIWISPIYPSPMADFGYDVADYCAIDPMFGTMEDFDRLLAEAHRRGLKVILDFVPNHTSDRHPWFLESRSSRDNPKRDWYIWRDQPNNWMSHFGGSAWEFDEKTGQYYLHSFLKEQPDLNWRNPAVKAAMFDALRFWLRKGVDGFRVDVMWLMIKDDQFRDNPPNPGYRLGQPPHNRLLPIYNSDRPEVHDLVAEMRGVVDEFPERVLIGEIYLPVPQLMMYYGVDLRGANLPFNFQLLQCAWSATAVARSDLAIPAGAARRSMAQLGAGQPRQRAHRVADRRPAGESGGHAPADACPEPSPCTTARNSACAMFPFFPTRCRIHSKRTSLGWGWAATRSERRCRGTARPREDLRRAGRGFRWATNTRS